MNNWEIIDNAGTIHSGTEEDMRFAFRVMQEPDKYPKAAEKYNSKWMGDLKLIQIHAIIR